MRKSYKEYSAEKTSFLGSHILDRVETSPLQGNVYYKTYICEDGAIWYERMEHKTITRDVEVEGFATTASVEVMETEYWSTDDSHSSIVYDRW